MDSILEDMKNNILDLSGNFGFLFQLDNKQRGRFSHAPFSLLPTILERNLYDELLLASDKFAILYHNICQNHQFIYQVLETSDHFVSNLLNIAKEKDLSGTQDYCELYLSRSDYMMECTDGKKLFKQVEFNTIACSFPCLSDKLSSLLKMVLHQYNQYDFTSKYDPSHLLVNNGTETIGDSIYDAYQYCPMSSGCILFVVQPNERNLVDQRHLEIYLHQKYNIKIYRRTFSEMKGGLSVDKNGNLFFNDDLVSLVYFRAGYSPADYQDEKCWEIRKRIELSRCVKIPNVYAQLSGCKKMQQELFKEGLTEKFISQDNASLLRRYYTGLYDLSDEHINNILVSPSKYVIKPNREGGGNNIFGNDMINFISKIKHSKNNYNDFNKDYIIMDYINSTTKTAYLVKDYQLLRTDDAVSEYGIFNVIISVNNRIKYNKRAGYLLRTKSKETNEGGVATGYSVLDTLLIDPL